jgi:hypothetical protein
MDRPPHIGSVSLPQAHLLATYAPALLLTEPGGGFILV